MPPTNDRAFTGQEVLESSDRMRVEYTNKPDMIGMRRLIFNKVSVSGSYIFNVEGTNEQYSFEAAQGKKMQGASMVYLNESNQVIDDYGHVLVPRIMTMSMSKQQIELADRFA